MTDTAETHASDSADGGPVEAAVDRQIELLRDGMILAWWAEQRPDAPAIVSSRGTRTFAELNANANRLARALRARGLVPGDAVALLCGNRPEFSEAIAAYQRAGYRMTPINWHLTADETAYIVADCEAKAFIAEADFADVAIAGAVSAPGATVRLAIGGSIDGFESYEDALAAEDGTDLTDPVAGTQMLYTSGTTGRPKGVYRNLSAGAALQLAQARVTFAYDAEGGDAHLCTGPLYHAAPLAFSLALPLAFGVTVVLMDRWDAEEALALISRHRITHTHMVPTMFHRLLSLPEEVRAEHDTSSLRFVLHGAAPCPVSVKHALIDWLGPIVWEYYAATEGTGSYVDSATWLQRPGTVGKPNPEGQVMIGDEDGVSRPAGEVGLVYLKAPDVGRFEYFKDQDKTTGAYRGTDYFTLGDVGYLDEDGYLFLTDRSANLIISGGVNIYPAEIDAVLIEHRAVGDVATIGVPNDEWGDEVKAIVELQRGYEPSDELADELIAFCAERLAKFKCPRTVDFVDELPRQDNGKIYKRLLRDRYRAASS